MTIHKEGRPIVALFFIVLVVINLLVYFFSSYLMLTWAIGIASFLFFLFIVRFFRKPNRPLITDDNIIKGRDTNNLINVNFIPIKLASKIVMGIRQTATAPI